MEDEDLGEGKARAQKGALNLSIARAPRETLAAWS